VVQAGRSASKAMTTADVDVVNKPPPLGWAPMMTRRRTLEGQGVAQERFPKRRHRLRRMGTELAPGRYQGGRAGSFFAFWCFGLPPRCEMLEGVGIELGRCRVGATKTRFLPKCAGTKHRHIEKKNEAVFLSRGVDGGAG